MNALLDDFAADIARRAIWSVRHNHGHPNAAWSTGEQLAVALVLRDEEHLNAMEYTGDEAIQRVRDGMQNPLSAQGFAAWLDQIRSAIAFEVLP